jgi:hypothetical protein
MSISAIEKEKLHLEIGKVSWLELQRFFAKGEAVWVSNELDLVEVAYQFSLDDTANAKEWLNTKKVAFVSDNQALEWFESNTELWAIVVKPFVLVQEMSHSVH